jgi:hypothetical protein
MICIDRTMMKTPVVLVAATLTVAILLAAFLLIATGTRGDDSLPLLTEKPASGFLSPAAK